MKSKALFINLISFYQKHISPLKKPSCVFYPTCSDYTKEAVEKYGVFRGIFYGARRISRCHPWQKNHLDPLK